MLQRFPSEDSQPRNSTDAVTARAMCESCGLKALSYGLLAEGKRRWCSNLF